MGQAKQAWIEAESRGYSLPESNEKYVCGNHFSDYYLKVHISDHSQAGRCNYCGSIARVIDLHDFMEYVAEKITEHFGNPGDEALYLSSSYYDDEDEKIPGFKRVGSFIAPDFAEHYESTYELLAELDLVTNDENLNKDIEDCFLNDEWIQHHAYMMTEGQELSFLWKMFAKMVMHEQRFTFFKRAEFSDEKFSEDNGLMDILTELGNLISRHGLCKEISSGTKLFRCRFTGEKDSITSFDNITSAPEDKAKQSRMSPAGISMFYGAFDSNTAVLESSPDGRIIDAPHVTGRFSTRKAMNVLDLTNLPHPSFWLPSNWEGIGFLHSFNWEITKPIIRDDRIHIQYIPSQVFTEYLRHVYQLANNDRIDGLIYKSSLKGATSSNIVLFYNQRRSAEILELIELIPFPKS
ncbi:MAG: HEPN-associated N-terminal domain-containing protein [Mariniphaga sp.]|nr:HEPN-associated N-terminal domain-containing protein [Mariniphaga sp.]